LYQLVPLMDVFRFPSYFRGIGMFFLIIGSGVAMEHFFSKKISRTTIRYFVLFSLSILALSLWGKFGVSASQSSEAKVHFFEHLSKQGWIHFGLLATLILGFLFLKKNENRKVLFLVLVSADLIFATQLNRTSTITHDIGTKKVNSAFHYYSPKEYPLPDLKVPFKKLHRVANWDYEHLHVNLNHFHKIPSPEGNSPIYFKRTAQAMANGIYQRTIENYPLIFAAEEMDRGGLILESTVDTFSFEKIVLEKFTPNQMKFSTNFSKPMHLVFLQNYHPDWKAFLNEKPNRIRIANQNFLSIKIPSGNQKIHFAFRPKFGKISFWISWCGWVFVSVFFITIYLRKIKKLLFFDHF